jgi:antitoxin component YwqK of YwqJK toxin-antitoxin module
MTERTRPQSVPAEAWWSEQDKEWILGPRDAQGRLHGKVRYWRPDGTLCCICDLVAGKPHGSSVRFHESGEEAQTCTFVDGAIHGTRTWYATDQPTTEGMHANGVSRKVRRLEMDYEHGEFLATRFFDGDGNPLCRDGSPLPPRPANVDPNAMFHEGRWVSGRWNEKGQRTGMLRHHTRDGVLLEETEWRDDVGEGVHRSFEDTGVPREQVTYRNGLREGTAFTYRLDGTLARTAELSRGEYHGALRDYDATGTRVVREVRFERGIPQTPRAPPPAPAPSTAPPGDWRERVNGDDPLSLNLAHLGLERLPDEVRAMRGLTSLSLVNNRLRSLPPWLMELESLRVLKLALNRMPLPRTGRGVLAHFRRTRALPALERRVRFHLFMGDVLQARREGDLSALVRALDDADPSIRAHAELALAGARPSPLVPGRRVHLFGVPRQRRRSALRRELRAAGLVEVPTRDEADVVLVCGRPGPLDTAGRAIAVEADLPALPSDARELARLYATAESHPQVPERRRARVRFRREAPLPLWAFVQAFTPGLDTYHQDQVARSIRLLGRSGLMDARTLAEELFRLTRVRGSTYLLEEGGPEARSLLAKSVQGRMLDLGWKGLRQLPPDLCDFPDVAWLKLRGNKLTWLPDELGNLFALNRLDLAHNPLKKLPASIVRLNQLRDLNCEDTKLTPATCEPLFALAGLTDLNLSVCDLKEVPEGLGQLTRLRELYLGYNGLRTLPASMARLQQLTYLHMPSNDLEVVPPVIFELRALKALWLESCDLRELPADIARLQALEKLVVWHNALESLPIDALTRLPNLKELRIRGNRLPPGHEAELRAALPRCAIY